MIAIIDYDAGNIKSVEKALEFIGESVVVTRNPQVILDADKVILPGVGAFGDAMKRLEEYHLVEVIHQVIDKGTPFLGICLGLQLLFDYSEESPGVKGLGVFSGGIVRFPNNTKDKIPQIGWNSLTLHNSPTILSQIGEEPYVYFVHSYYLQAENEDIVVATTEYAGVTVHASVQKNNVFACQFHPEKSGEVGLQILRNFAQL